MAASKALLLFASLILLISTTTSASEIDIQPDDADAADFDGVTRASSLAQIFSRLGFQEMSAMAPFMYDSTTTHTNIGSAWPGPFTIFAPSDSSIDACSSCSLPLLLQEHSVPGVYDFNYLQTLPFGSRIQTLIHNRCLTVTKSYTGDDDGNEKVFVGAVEVTRPDLHNDGFYVIHGLDGYVSHLSSLSCEVEKTTSLSFDSAPESPYGSPDENHHHQHSAASPTTVMRVMLDDVTLRLRSTGYSTLALALKIRYEELQRLQSMTIFALSDVAIFRLGHGYVQNLGFHIVPDILLTEEILTSYPTETEFQTMEPGSNLIITSIGDELMINYVAVREFGFISNFKIVIHQISEPFRVVVGLRSSVVDQFRGRIEGGSGMDFKGWSDEYGDYGFEQSPVISDYQAVPVFDDYHGL